MPARQPSRIGQDFGKVVEDVARLVADLVTAATARVRSLVESGSRRLGASPSYGDGVPRPNETWSKAGLIAARESGIEEDDLEDWALANSPENVELMDTADRTIKRARQSGASARDALRGIGYRSLSEVEADIDESTG